jgi:outer membrane biosynthesis protein TonB/DNA-binding transcriptional ArsR family regulator
MGRLLPFQSDQTAKPGDPRVLDLEDEATDEALSALSSETARKILQSVYEEPKTPPELRDEVGTSLQNVHYHVENLEDAELIQPAGSGYSEKGTEMTVYAPASEAFVLFAGQERQRSQLASALKRLLGAVALLAVGSLTFRELIETMTGGAFLSAGDSAAPEPQAGDGGGDGASGGDGGGVDGADSGEDIEIVQETAPNDGMASPTPTSEPTPSPRSTPTAEPSATPGPSPTPGPMETPTPTPGPAGTPTPTPAPTVEPAPTPRGTPTVAPTETPVPTAEPTPSPTEAPTSTPTPTETPTETQSVDLATETSARVADAAAQSPLEDPAVTFFLGGAFMLAAVGVWAYTRR